MLHFLQKKGDHCDVIIILTPGNKLENVREMSYHSSIKNITLFDLYFSSYLGVI